MPPADLRAARANRVFCTDKENNGLGSFLYKSIARGRLFVRATTLQQQERELSRHISMTESATLPAYAELHCLSNFSFLRGASHPEELVARAQQLGYSALALTDECSFAGVVRAHTAARECGLPLILGSEIQLADGPQLVLLATGREGYGNLSELITLGRRRGAKGNYILETKDLDQGLPGCLALLLPGAVPDVAQARWLAERFNGRGWIAYGRFLAPSDAAHLERLREHLDVLARSLGRGALLRLAHQEAPCPAGSGDSP